MKGLVDVVIGVVVMITMILSMFSTLVLSDGFYQNIGEALVVNAVLMSSLFFAYLLNRPKASSSIVGLYKIKWRLAVGVISIFIVGGLLAFSPFIVEISDIRIRRRNTGVPLGSVLVIIAIWLSVILFARVMWRCPACNKRLPFLEKGASKRVGFAIKKCKNCNAKLNNA
ncbi:hypothetical protein MIB92_17025 [Aestuariirhabdus sp. Z084]|uniref:hypothetical protein n=1 Tax=Aestuariirhabdus haliotis TaxID=2918751 RepID=UPI00201B397B|nr:hypothetical protein [Aestuariirhabdus haliotis]MCL6417365.1 hypothetical protein [Aestuariirhabdus haliotis]MCL6421310.1 hypothetical protein [Aestuariirhabdus haliotis]